MSSNVQNYLRPTGTQNRKDVNKILEALQDLFASPVEEEAVHERIALTPHRKKKTHATTTGELIDESQTESIENETETMLRVKPSQVKSYSLTHSETGTPTYSVQGTKHGGRITFDGSTSLAINDDSLLDITDEITLSGYFYLPATESGDTTVFLLSKGVYSLEVQPHVIGANTIRGNVTIGGTFYDVTGTYTANAWNQIVLTWKSPNVKLYINGTLEDTNSNASGVLDTNSDSFEIGDGTEPSASSSTVALTSTASSPTNAPIPMTATFSNSDFSGFTSGDIVINSGSVSSFVDNNPIFTFTVTPSAQGNITVDIPADVAFDRNGGGNTAAPQFSITYDSVAPSAPVIDVYSPDPTYFTTITITGTGETGAVVTLTSSIDGSVGTDTVTSGTWSITTSVLSLGTHSFTATQEDSAGNTSPVSSIELLTIELGYMVMESGESLLLETGSEIIL